MEKLIAKFNKYVSLEEKEIEPIRNYFHKKRVKKGDYLLKKGEICNKIFYVDRGLIMLALYKENRKFVAKFCLEDDLCCEGISFLKEIPTKYCIEVFEDSTIYEINKQDFYNLYKISYKWDRVVRLIMEEHILELVERFADINTITTKERYLKLLDNNAEIFTRVPQYVIASHLGITPEALSKIRKQLAQRK